MIDNNHPSFSPPTLNCKLWRYMDLTKLLCILENKTLVFPRSDKFEDPYEGSLSKASLTGIGSQTFGGGVFPVPYGNRQNIEGFKNQKKYMYISCWFMSEYESAAMWKLYLQSNEGVAILTDHDTLLKCFGASPLLIRTSKVKYIDYDKTIIPINNGFFPFLYKRLSFEHENELRAIIHSEEQTNMTPLIADAPIVEVAVDPKELIHAVYVSPRADSWVGDLVEKLLCRYEIDCPIERSRLYERPLW